MSEQTQETAVVKPETKALAPVGVGEKGLTFNDLEGMLRVARYVVASGFAPKGMDKPESVLIAMQMGLEIGLTPMAALQNIAVINGRPGIYGDAALALVRKSGLVEDYSEEYEGTGDNLTAVITSKREGMKSPMVTRFSVADAKRAELWGKPGPWKQYPERMLKWRARGFNLRDNFGDVLKGLRTTEELQDMETEERGFEKAKQVFGVVTEEARQEAKAEALQALKNVIQDVTPEPPTPLAQLEQFLDDNRFTTLDLLKFGHDSGVIPDALNIKALSEIPEAVINRLLKAKSGLAAKIQAQKEAA